MRTRMFGLGLGISILVAGCSAPPALLAPAASLVPPDPKVVTGIARACVASGLFKLVGNGISVAYPAAALPLSVINAGVDKVCADPERFASDVSTIEWVVKNLAAVSGAAIRLPL